MKVCLVTPEFLPTWGGVGTYTYNLARGLRGKADVHVLTATHPGPTADGRDLDGIQIHATFPEDSTAADVSPLRFQVAVMRMLPRLTRAHGFEILHANHATMSDFLARIRRTSAARVLTVHTTLDTQIGGTRDAGAGMPRHSLEGTVFRWRFFLQALERRYLQRTPWMIFVSNWVRERTLRRYRVRPRLDAVVPNAIDTAMFSPADRYPGPRPDADDNRRTLLFAGRLLALKGIDTLLQAVGRLPSDVRVLLAGPGDPTAWKALARRLALSEDRCRFLGPVPYAQMPALYRQADAVVLPSFAESYPMVALEAMASGTPLVSSDVGGISEIVQDEITGWLLPPGDAVRLAERIETVLADPARARKVSSNGRAWVEAHASIKRMVDDTMRFYGRVLAGEAS